jgi:hypothetical protein
LHLIALGCVASTWAGVKFPKFGGRSNGRSG